MTQKQSKTYAVLPPFSECPSEEIARAIWLPTLFSIFWPKKRTKWKGDSICIGLAVSAPYNHRLTDGLSFYIEREQIVPMADEPLFCHTLRVESRAVVSFAFLSAGRQMKQSTLLMTLLPNCWVSRVLLHLLSFVNQSILGGRVHAVHADSWVKSLTEWRVLKLFSAV